jgi:hypothetical protein
MKSTQDQIKYELMDFFGRSYNGIPEQLTPNELKHLEELVNRVSYWLQIAHQRDNLTSNL